MVQLTKIRVRSLVQLGCIVSIVATIWILPVREATCTRVTLPNNDAIPLLTVNKELNATQVEVGAFCLVTITISNLTNNTAYNVNSRDTVFPKWVFEIKGSPSHSWISIGNMTTVSYSYILRPSKHGTFQLQQANITYSSKDAKVIRSALSNEVELFVPPFKVPTPIRGVENLQTILLAEITILVILIIAVLSRRKITA